MSDGWSPHDPGHAPRAKITQRHVIHLSLPDRLRVLFGAAVIVVSELDTENCVGATRQKPTITEVRLVPR